MTMHAGTRKPRTEVTIKQVATAAGTVSGD